MNWWVILFGIGCFLVGGMVGFLLCAVLTSVVVSEAKSQARNAQDYIKLLRDQVEQN